MSENQNIFPYPLDVSDKEKDSEIFQKIIRDFGGIDLCIFSSGIYERSLEKEIDIENIKKTFE